MRLFQKLLTGFILFLSLFAGLNLIVSGEPGGPLQVHFIDVGQGDAILIRGPDADILIDGGSRDGKAAAYLKSLKVEQLDLIISTHPHADHIGGLIQIIQEFPVKEIIDPGVAHTTKTFEEYLTLIDAGDIPFVEARAGLERTFGDMKIVIIHPSEPGESSLNNSSAAARLTYGSVSFLFTGDIELQAEEEILESGINIRSTILKVSHHGSSSSSGEAFLKAVSPEAAVIMCGRANRYGHPHWEVLDRLSVSKVRIYRTDIHGSVIFTSDGQKYSVNVSGPYLYKRGELPRVSPINLNTASLEELQEIVHIGQERAEEIIQLRPIRSLDDLKKINGIGDGRLRDIKRQGRAAVDPPGRKK